MSNSATKAVAGVCARPMRLWLALGLILVSCWPALAGQFYDYKIIAQTGSGSIGALVPHSFSSPTINNNGHVAFVAYDQTAGSALVRWNGSQNEELSVSFSGNYGSAAIDDSDRVGTRFSATSGGNSFSAIRRFSGPGSYVTLKEAGNARVNGNFVYPY